MSGWIDPNKRLPRQYKDILIYYPGLYYHSESHVYVGQFAINDPEGEFPYLLYINNTSLPVAVNKTEWAWSPICSPTFDNKFIKRQRGRYYAS